MNFKNFNFSKYKIQNFCQWCSFNKHSRSSIPPRFFNRNDEFVIQCRYDWHGQDRVVPKRLNASNQTKPYLVPLVFSKFTTLQWISLGTVNSFTCQPKKNKTKKKIIKPKTQKNYKTKKIVNAIRSICNCRQHPRKLFSTIIIIWFFIREQKKRVCVIC